ncbi:MAG: alpha/beta hydrolase [Salinisphaeraceae bacterium]
MPLRRAGLVARVLAVSLLTALTAACSGQQLVNTLASTGGYELHAGQAYGNLPRQQLDVYEPDNDVPDRPVVVFFYGGRWSSGERAGFRFVAQALTSRGYVAVVPDYRLYPEVRFPDFVEDGARATAWVREHAVDYGGDPGRLFLMGHSAGAHIAAMLATDERYLQAVGGSPDWLAGMIGLAGPYEFLPITAEDLKDTFGPEDTWPASQPVNFVDGNEPPMLLMHGADDVTVHAEDSEILAEKVHAAGGQAALELYPGIGHIRLIGNLGLPLRWFAPQLDRIAAFVDETAAKIGPSPETR